ncbi:unnamed protein product, partial [Rotaria sp. Silwood1]
DDNTMDMSDKKSNLRTLIALIFQKPTCVAADYDCTCSDTCCDSNRACRTLTYPDRFYDPRVGDYIDYDVTHHRCYHLSFGTEYC